MGAANDSCPWLLIFRLRVPRWRGNLARGFDYETQQLLACFTVADTGIGLPADKIAGLFKPFSQIKHLDAPPPCWHRTRLGHLQTPLRTDGRHDFRRKSPRRRYHLPVLGAFGEFPGRPRRTIRPETKSLMLRRWKVWRRGPESNRRIELLQSSALPLGNRAKLSRTRNV